jgi:hypothetical protein
VPVGYSAPLEQVARVDAGKIAAAARGLMQA